MLGRRTCLVALVTLAAACRAPTQITVEIYTDLPCSKTTRTLVRVGTLDTIRTAPWITDTTNCVERRVGSLVVVPSGSHDASVAVEVMTRVSGDPKACDESSADTFVGCIAARRALTFVDHSSLDLPIDLYAACVGKICDPRQTCVKGTCVEATITDPTTCHGDGCRLGTGTGGDAGADGDATIDTSPDADAAIDTSPDATADDTLDTLDTLDVGSDGDAGPVSAGFVSSPGTASKAFPTASAIAVGADGSTYAALPFSGSITLDAPYTSMGADFADVVLVKLDPRGKVVWSRLISGDGDEVPVGVSLSNDGTTIYVSGDSNSSMLTIGSKSFPTGGSGNLFLGAYATDGTFVTAAWYDGGIYDAHTTRTVVDGSGDLLMAVTIGTTVWWDGSPRGSTSADVVMMRFSGVDLSLTKMVLLGDAVGAQIVNGLASTPLGPVIVGSFTGTIGTLTSTAGDDAFAIGLDAGFAERWAASTVDTGTPPSSGSALESVFLDGAGHLVMAGSTGPPTTKFAGHDVAGTGVFVATLANDGSWVSGTGFGTGYGIDFRIDVAPSPLGGFSLFATYNGSAGGTFTFDAARPLLTSLGGDDVVLVEFDGTGAVTGQHVFGDAGDQSSGRIVIAPSGDRFVSGLYTGALDFGITPGLPVGSGTLLRPYLARLP